MGCAGTMTEIREATPADAALLQTLYQHLIPDEPSAPEPVAADRIASLSAFQGSCSLLAMDHATYTAAGYVGTKTGFQKRRIADRAVT